MPGSVTSYIAKLERAGVQSAQRAFWYEYGTVNGLVVNNNQPTGTWWLYKWYGDMAGNMVQTVPATQTGLDGFAAYDSTRRIVDVVFGDESGTNSVRVNGLSALGGSVQVTAGVGAELGPVHRGHRADRDRHHDVHRHQRPDHRAGADHVRDERPTTSWSSRPAGCPPTSSGTRRRTRRCSAPPGCPALERVQRRLRRPDRQHRRPAQRTATWTSS